MARQFEESKKKKKSLNKRILKYTGITFLLLLIIAIALPFIFKDKLIEVVKEEVNDNVNAIVEFGDFDLSIIKSFPNFSFEIKDFPNGQKFVKYNFLQVNYQLLPFEN